MFFLGGKCLKKVIGNLAYREMLFYKKPSLPVSLNDTIFLIFQKMSDDEEFGSVIFLKIDVDEVGVREVHAFREMYFPKPELCWGPNSTC